MELYNIPELQEILNTRSKIFNEKCREIRAKLDQLEDSKELHRLDLRDYYFLRVQLNNWSDTKRSLPITYHCIQAKYDNLVKAYKLFINMKAELCHELKATTSGFTISIPTTEIYPTRFIIKMLTSYYNIKWNGMLSTYNANTEDYWSFKILDKDDHILIDFCFDEDNLRAIYIKDEM